MKVWWKEYSHFMKGILLCWSRKLNIVTLLNTKEDQKCLSVGRWTIWIFVCHFLFLRPGVTLEPKSLVLSFVEKREKRTAALAFCCVSNENILEEGRAGSKPTGEQSEKSSELRWREREKQKLIKVAL